MKNTDLWYKLHRVRREGILEYVTLKVYKAAYSYMWASGLAPQDYLCISRNYKIRAFQLQIQKSGCLASFMGLVSEKSVLLNLNNP